MAISAASIGREDRLDVVGHLEEPRARLIISLAALAVAFGLCVRQNHALLKIINRTFAHQTEKQVRAERAPLAPPTACSRTLARWPRSYSSWWTR